MTNKDRNLDLDYWSVLWPNAACPDHHLFYVLLFCLCPGLLLFAVVSTLPVWLCFAKIKPVFGSITPLSLPLRYRYPYPDPAAMDSAMSLVLLSQGTCASTDTCYKMATSPETFHKMAAIPESLPVMARATKSVPSCPRLASSVEDPPLVSVQVAGYSIISKLSSHIVSALPVCWKIHSIPRIHSQACSSSLIHFWAHSELMKSSSVLTWSWRLSVNPLSYPSHS